eukprot:CAMPEP_0180428182 /NCGR_PEP_ID=MMETSP1036_2-20121128/6703_1 /TAXON_ID=632150 /ORGANISM="Azadinium spinosum, Strain 3D9" /LENGTH=103 /DNA_ID=CAMNT_0022433807 /DNA_START=1210 /DNA_END=1521 /DNA_ORIENTATION=-
MCAAKQTRVLRSAPDVFAGNRCCSKDGSSCVASHMGCMLGHTHRQAQDACAAAGLRLCTRTELTANVCCASSCKYHCQVVWSSSAGELNASADTVVMSSTAEG